MNHSFDVDIAKEYGLHCAIILQNIVFWIEKNKANEKHFHDGTYWTYNSVKAFGDMFPYLTAKQIRTALQRLEDDGLIKTGNYNTLDYDRTKWYSLTEKGNSLFHLWQTDLPQRAKGNAPEGKAIPDINTDNKPDIKERKKEEATFDSIIDAYSADEEIRSLLREWLKIRKLKRAPLTDRALSMNLNKLDKTAKESGLTVKAYLEEVICRGWQAFYPIKGYNNSQPVQGQTNGKSMIPEHLRGKI